MHTDVDDFARVMREIGRALAPGGTFAALGVHLCFVGHHVERPDKSDARPGPVSGHCVDASDLFEPGIRSRVGAHHVRLGPFLTAVIDPGLVLDRIVEAGDGIVPWMLGVAARKPDVGVARRE